ncbi:MAG TPA: UvrD-helicase domain-containing protein [Acidimicrobiia bacterium]|nr:UvrD-helicase domain-containing protein [Acidimicrobiia bacterium]
MPESQLLQELNPAQREAVAATEGPVLVVAGAGSGKTRVLTRRIAHLIRDLDVPPHAILAITFTNKAASEMKERVGRLIGPVARNMWVSTFHSACSRILRREAHRLGYRSAFSIYDAADSLRLITLCVKDLDLDPKRFPPRNIRAAISNAKNELIDYETFAANDAGFYHEKVADVYRLYQQRLVEASAMDFDDLLMITCELFQAFPDVLRSYQERFRYVLIDEYQDTNHAQYILVKLLTEQSQNLCVVGDGDQCLPPGTMIATPQGARPIETVEVGDEISGTGRHGTPVVGRVSAVKESIHAGLLYSVQADDVRLFGTPHHIVPARLDFADDDQLVYLMYRKDRGFRLGTTRAFRSNSRGKRSLGLSVRLNQEHADKVWIVRVCSDRTEASFWEAYYSAQYGIPTACFHANGRGLAMDDVWLERLFDELDTRTAAKFLMEELDLLFDYPHCRPQSGARRQSLNLTMFADRRSGDFGYHRVQWSSNRSDVADRLRDAGFRVRAGKFPGTWRVETSRKSYSDALELAKGMADAADLEINRRMAIGRRIYDYTPLAHLRRGMRVLVARAEDFEEATVDRVDCEEYAGPIFDLEVSPTHNYVADSMLVHNSVYAFRGADIRNIMEFEKDFPDARIVLLEQNYRSTEMILEAANAVITNNVSRKPKRLWTDLGRGEPILTYEAEDEHDEAAFVAEKVGEFEHDKLPLSDIAVFYRTNAQSRVIEEVFVKFGVPYQVIGGVKYYDRREVKDALAYLRALVNPADTVAMKRIVNTPKRSIGDTSVAHVDRFAEQEGINFWEGLQRAGENPRLSARAQKSMAEFVALMEHLSTEMAKGPKAALEAILADTGYMAWVRSERSIEAMGREENLRELVSAADDFEETGPITLGDADWEDAGGVRRCELFLESISLVTDVDSLESTDVVTLMTLHNAKGLEFPVVFMTGMEDGVFPHMRSLGDPKELEEERRLAYVGITRAMRRLFLTRAWSRNLWGTNNYNPASRFLGEIPDHLVVQAKRARRIPAKETAGPARSHVEAVDIGTGDRVRHSHWGTGTVREVIGAGDRAEAVVNFDAQGVKRLLLAWAPLERVGG